MAIITLTEYKAYKGISSTTDDTKRQNIIDAVNSYIVSYCNRTFNDYISTTKTEYFDATDGELYPSEYPLTGITTIKTSTDAGETYDTTLAEFTNYVLDLPNSRIVSIDADVFVSTSYPINAIEVIYNGGFTDIPEDIKLAAVNLVDYYLEEQYTPSKAFAGVRVENIVGIDAGRLPSHIKMVLDHYRSANL